MSHRCYQQPHWWALKQRKHDIIFLKGIKTDQILECLSQPRLGSQWNKIQWYHWWLLFCSLCWLRIKYLTMWKNMWRNAEGKNIYTAKANKAEEPHDCEQVANLDFVSLFSHLCTFMPNLTGMLFNTTLQSCCVGFRMWGLFFKKVCRSRVLCLYLNWVRRDAVTHGLNPKRWSAEWLR